MQRARPPRDPRRPEGSAAARRSIAESVPPPLSADLPPPAGTCPSGDRGTEPAPGSSAPVRPPRRGHRVCRPSRRAGRPDTWHALTLGMQYSWHAVLRCTESSIGHIRWGSELIQFDISRSCVGRTRGSADLLTADVPWDPIPNLPGKSQSLQIARMCRTTTIQQTIYTTNPGWTTPHHVAPPNTRPLLYCLAVPCRRRDGPDRERIAPAAHHSADGVLGHGAAGGADGPRRRRIAPRLGFAHPHPLTAIAVTAAEPVRRAPRRARARACAAAHGRVSPPALRVTARGTRRDTGDDR